MAMTKKKIAQLKRFEKLVGLMETSRNLGELQLRLEALREYRDKNRLWGMEFEVDGKKVPYFGKQMHYTERSVYQKAISWDEDRYIAWVNNDYVMFERDANIDFLMKLRGVMTCIHQADNDKALNVSYAMLLTLLEMYGQEGVAIRLVGMFYSDMKQNPQYQF